MGPTDWACNPGLLAGAKPFVAGARVFARFATNSHGLGIILQGEIAYVSGGCALGAAQPETSRSTSSVVMWVRITMTIASHDVSIGYALQGKVTEN